MAFNWFSRPSARPETFDLIVYAPEDALAVVPQRAVTHVMEPELSGNVKATHQKSEPRVWRKMLVMVSVAVALIISMQTFPGEWLPLGGLHSSAIFSACGLQSCPSSGHGMLWYHIPVDFPKLLEAQGGSLAPLLSYSTTLATAAQELRTISRANVVTVLSVNSSPESEAILVGLVKELLARTQKLGEDTMDIRTSIDYAASKFIATNAIILTALQSSIPDIIPRSSLYSSTPSTQARINASFINASEVYGANCDYILSNIEDADDTLRLVASSLAAVRGFGEVGGDGPSDPLNLWHGVLSFFNLWETDAFGALGERHPVLNRISTIHGELRPLIEGIHAHAERCRMDAVAARANAVQAYAPGGTGVPMLEDQIASIISTTTPIEQAIKDSRVASRRP